MKCFSSAQKKADGWTRRPLATFMVSPRPRRDARVREAKGKCLWQHKRFHLPSLLPSAPCLIRSLRSGGKKLFVVLRILRRKLHSLCSPALMDPCATDDGCAIKPRSVNGSKMRSKSVLAFQYWRLASRPKLGNPKSRRRAVLRGWVFAKARYYIRYRCNSRLRLFCLRVE